MWGWSKGQGELESILAFHKLPRKASGIHFRKSTLGLSPESETSGLWRVVQVSLAPLTLAVNPSLVLPPTKANKEKIISSISKVSSPLQPSLHFLMLHSLQGPNCLPSCLGVGGSPLEEPLAPSLADWPKAWAQFPSIQVSLHPEHKSHVWTLTRSIPSSLAQLLRGLGGRGAGEESVQGPGGSTGPYFPLTP